MAGRKRRPNQLLRIKTIYEGEMKTMLDQVYFILNEEPVPRVRLHGIVIDRYDSSPEVERPYCFLTIDDGSDTISIKQWSRKNKQENGDYIDTLSSLQSINVGDIIDVIGRVRQFEDELYIVPISISQNMDLDWEIHRRSQLLEEEINQFGLNETEQEIWINETTENEKEVEKDKLVSSILAAFEDDSQNNTLENLQKKTNIPTSKLEAILQELRHEGIILEPRSGYFERLDAH